MLISCAQAPERGIMLPLAVSIPTYNRADILADRLARMSKMQRRIELEISICDDASTDHTGEVAAAFRKSFAGFSYVRQRRRVGPTINFFAALRGTTFPYVTQIGDDDTIFEDGMLKALELLDAERDLQAVVGNYLLYDFVNDKPISVSEFIRVPERYSLEQFDIAFEGFYFLEYMVMRRKSIDSEYYNEGLSYQTGWKLFLANLVHGPIRLETSPLICKGVSADQEGWRNYCIEFQDWARADPEWYAARRIPSLSAEVRNPLMHAALMRTVRYSSDSTVNANAQKKYLIGLHHAQKAAAYDYDTKDYPKFPDGELVLGRLYEWLVAVLLGAPQVERVVCEDHPVCMELQYRLKGGLAQIAKHAVRPLEQLKEVNSEWVITWEHQPHLAKAAMKLPIMTYVAVRDLLMNSIDNLQQFDELFAPGDDLAAGKEASTSVLELLAGKLVGARLPVAPAELAGGLAIASGDGAGSPERAYDGNPQTFWISAERGTGVKDQAWIGYAFAEPQAIRRIRLDQTSNPGFRQDLVRVEKSLDGGLTWVAAARAPAQLRGESDWIDLPEREPARLWRLIAAGDNATESRHAWTPFRILFLVAQTPGPPDKPEQ